ncbi:site-2 protease family protein [Candidatus Aerophobetes bacterium]|nr:site-2 protease family protein [Candidatus Aerophobetes bacterium]
MRAVVIILGLVVLFFSVILHEVAHGLVAERHGDPTARIMGRITLNPLSHVDPIGTVFLPGLLIILNLFGSNVPIFGWAKPVPVNPANLNNPKKDMILVALAGPVTNIIIAFLLAFIFRFFVLPGSLAGIVLFYGTTINLFLAFFNLIPIPPLDGSRILSGFLPEHLSFHLAQIEPFGFIILIFLLAGGVLGHLFSLLVKLSALLTGIPFFFW